MKTEDKINDGGPAFPRPASPAEFTDHCQDGLSLRDYFAAKAMHAIMQRYEADTSLSPDVAYAKLAKSAYSIADAMLRARTQPEAK